jgi:hypothetical protein
MTAVVERVGLKLVSNPYTNRTGLIPLGVAIVLGWVFVLLWCMIAAVAFTQNMLAGAMLLFSLSAFATFLSFLTYTMVRDAYRDYIFEITETDAVLLVIDRLQHKRSTQMVLLDDIKYAEYYPYRDSASIIFHAPYIEMEVPLWPMGGRAQDVVDFLDGRGVRVVNVQSDEPIPD